MTQACTAAGPATSDELHAKTSCAKIACGITFATQLPSPAPSTHGGVSGQLPRTVYCLKHLGQTAPSTPLPAGAAAEGRGRV